MCAPSAKAQHVATDTSITTTAAAGANLFLSSASKRRFIKFSGRQRGEKLLPDSVIQQLTELIASGSLGVGDSR